MKTIRLIFTGDFPDGEVKNSRIKSIGEQFKSNGWEVEFVAMYPTSFSKSRKFQQNNNWKKIKVRHLTHNTIYPKSKIMRGFQIIEGHIKLLYLTIFHLNKNEVIYFYTPQWLGTLLGLIVSRVRKLNTIVDQTDLHSYRSFKLLHKFEEWLIAKIPLKLSVISLFLVNHFKSLGRSEVYHTSIMVDVDRFDLKILPDKYVLGYIGSFAKKDGIPMLIKSFAAAKKQIPKLKLRLIGFNPFEMKTKKMIDFHGLSDSIELVGQVDYDSIPILLKKCDTFIMNRNNSSFSKTGYPIKLGEYFAANRPVLMSDSIGFSEDFNHLSEVIKYKVEDIDSLSKAIIWRYKNDKESLLISENGQSYALNHFNSNVVALKFIEIAEELLWKKK